MAQQRQVKQPSSTSMNKRDESLRCRPGKTPTWRNRLHQENEDWAEHHWWNPLYLIFFNVLILATIVPLNVLILMVVAWPLVVLYRWQLIDHKSLCGVVFVIFVGKIVSLYFQPDEDPRDNRPVPAEEQKTVAVVGAGPAGLAVAKELLAEGHVPVVFEQAEAIGGVWQRSTDKNSDSRGRVLPNTITSSSALNTAFSDFPIQAEYPGPDPFFATQEDYMDYIHRYAKYFDLNRHVHFKTKVVALAQAEEGDRWRVEMKSTATAASQTMDFDAVAVCSGQTNVPRIPKIQGQHKFPGKIFHSSDLYDFNDFRKFAGKQVLVVGGGETASDVLLDISAFAAKCDVSIRSPVLVLPRNLWGGAPDYTEPRTLYLAGRISRWATYKCMNLPSLFWNAFARQYRGRTIWVPHVKWLLKLLFTRKFIVECIQGKRSSCASIQTTKSDSILYVLQNNPDKCQLRSEIKCINQDGNVVFEGSKVGKYDFIVLTTGYEPSRFPFLPLGFETNHLHDRYLGVFHPELPSMAFIGFMRGNVGSLALGFELQARWFSLICSNKRFLPEKREMLSYINTSREQNGCYNGTLATWFYANYLARNCVGCEPNFVRFFLQHPLTCIKAYCGNFTSYQFRMRGPHRDPQVVVDGYGLSDGIFYLPIMWHSLHLLWMLQGFCFELWSMLGFGFLDAYVKPLLSQWY